MKCYARFLTPGLIYDHFIKGGAVTQVPVSMVQESAEICGILSWALARGHHPTGTDASLNSGYLAAKSVSWRVSVLWLRWQGMVTSARL